jgi:Arc/MetJ-type ribon-helix-helix transcriptional regulator
MINDTEKITINLGVVELAQIDVLVEQGIYSNRSDFMRQAIRKQLDGYRSVIENQLAPFPSGKKWRFTIGITTLTRKSLEQMAADNEKLSISVIGMLIVDADVEPALFADVVERFSLKGKLVASDEIKGIIKTMN